MQCVCEGQREKKKKKASFTLLPRVRGEQTCACFGREIFKGVEGLFFFDTLVDPVDEDLTFGIAWSRSAHNVLCHVGACVVKAYL